MKAKLISLLFFLPILLIAQEKHKFSKNYIPKNINECLIQLDNILQDSVKQKITTFSEDEFVDSSHFSLGMDIRDKWGLWNNSVLLAYFHELGIYHPDDMSEIILRCYYRHFKDKPLDFITMINHIRSENDLDTLQTEDEESLLNHITKFKPFARVTHNLSGGIGFKQVNYSNFSNLLKDNNFPETKREEFLINFEYLGNYKKIYWTFSYGELFPYQMQKDENIVDGFTPSLGIGIGYPLYRNRKIGIISFINYGIEFYSYHLYTEDSSEFNFENWKNITDLKLNQYTQRVNTGIRFFYDIVPYYSNLIGITINYDFKIGETGYNDNLMSITKDKEINNQGIEILLSFIVRIP